MLHNCYTYREFYRLFCNMIVILWTSYSLLLKMCWLVVGANVMTVHILSGCICIARPRLLVLFCRGLLSANTLSVTGERHYEKETELCQS